MGSEPHMMGWEPHMMKQEPHMMKQDSRLVLAYGYHIVKVPESSVSSRTL
jgi:hypothetical protein